jgi:hypothetical protein
VTPQWGRKFCIPYRASSKHPRRPLVEGRIDHRRGKTSVLDRSHDWSPSLAPDGFSFSLAPNCWARSNRRSVAALVSTLTVVSFLCPKSGFASFLVFLNCLLESDARGPLLFKCLTPIHSFLPEPIIGGRAATIIPISNLVIPCAEHRQGRD